MVLAVDLVEDGLHLEAVIALDVQEAPGVVIVRAYGGLVRQVRVASVQRRRRPGLKVRGIGVDFRRVVVVDISAIARAAHGRIRRMLVRPGRVTSRAMYNSENRIGADKVPRIDRIAILVADQAARIDRVDPAVAARRITVEIHLRVDARDIDVDALVVFGARDLGENSFRCWAPVLKAGDFRDDALRCTLRSRARPPSSVTISGAGPALPVHTENSHKSKNVRVSACTSLERTVSLLRPRRAGELKLLLLEKGPKPEFRDHTPATARRSPLGRS